MRQSAQCLICKNFHRTDDGLIRTCKAFPRGIPRELAGSYVEHTKPYRGDHGIQFEAVFDDEGSDDQQTNTA